MLSIIKKQNIERLGKVIVTINEKKWTNYFIT